MTAPRGTPEKIWCVTWTTGQRHFFDKDPLEGIEAWSKGTPATVAAYTFDKIIHTPPPPPKKKTNR